EHVRAIANWAPNAPRTHEIPFVVGRVLLQDFTGVPLLVDLAAMRAGVARLGRDPKLIEPIVPVDLVVDHSVQVDFAGSADAFSKNLQIEFVRNRERYEFLKWAAQAFANLRIVPPGIGIIHQVNLEYIAKGVLWAEAESDGARVRILYPDTLVGTDSHTTMINGLGILGWGVGGIEAEAAMLGQPIYLLMPDVVGVYMTGELPPGATATDLALALTQLLRKTNVVGKFVEFFGPGAARMPVVDRAVVANMAPEYGATTGFFPIDEACLEYLRQTGRSESHCRLYEAYYRAQGMWGTPRLGTVTYSQVIQFDLGSVRPCVAGPKQPHQRIELDQLKRKFAEVFTKPIKEGGYGKPETELSKRVHVGGAEKTDFSDAATSPGGEPVAEPSESEMQNQHPTLGKAHPGTPRFRGQIGHGSVLIAAITSCTNTSNPSLMLAAGLLARKAVERGLKVPGYVKTSLAPGSRVVSEYLTRTGLQTYLDRLGFNLVAYGCTTCIGNSGPLEP
ncbi:MAG: aconitate hydratase AcnA, partial [Verrucomicrobiae bacterium]|nr:aconitate hydratase AcnA [Verrucomicrobiae bacterium]